MTWLNRVAEKMIGIGQATGMQDSMRATFRAGLPDTFDKMVANMQKKLGRMPFLEECRARVRDNGTFLKSAEMMGIDKEEVDDFLVDALKRAKGYIDKPPMIADNKK